MGIEYVSLCEREKQHELGDGSLRFSAFITTLNPLLDLCWVSCVSHHHTNVPLMTLCTSSHTQFKQHAEFSLLSGTSLKEKLSDLIN